jgi:hypothetical protein
MRPTDPPAIATWMLEHLTLAGKNEALAGDLLEEFRLGRPRSWYWRQVAVAITLGCAKGLRNQWLAVVFAALWTVSDPVFGFYVVTIQKHKLMDFTAGIDWINSWVCGAIFEMGSLFAFLWVGLTLYILLNYAITRSLDLSRLVRGLLVSSLGIAAWIAAVIAFSQPVEVDVGRETVGSPIFGGHLLPCLPYFLSLLTGLWVALPKSEDGHVGGLVGRA